MPLTGALGAHTAVARLADAASCRCRAIRRPAMSSVTRTSATPLETCHRRERTRAWSQVWNRDRMGSAFIAIAPRTVTTARLILRAARSVVHPLYLPGAHLSGCSLRLHPPVRL